MREVTAKVRQIPAARSSPSPQAENNAICPNECRVPVRVRQFFNIVRLVKWNRGRPTIPRRVRGFTAFLTYCFVSARSPFLHEFSILLVSKIKDSECMLRRLDTPTHFRVTGSKGSNASLRILLRDGERTIKCHDVKDTASRLPWGFTIT